MSIFISYNFDTGRAAAQAVATQLEQYGLDVWWLPDKLELSQLDSIVERALATCQRCLVIWSAQHLSEWQHAEIQAIRMRLRQRNPPADSTDFFMVIRIPYGEAHTLPSGHLPLLECSEYLDYSTLTEPLPYLQNLQGYTPGLLPLMSGQGQQPYFHGLTESECPQGQRAFTGGIEAADDAKADLRYCWLFLEDAKGKWYIQQPRPTFTHAQRWIAPSVYVGENIKAVILAAASLATHHKLVATLLAGQWGALHEHKLGELTVLQRLPLSVKAANKPRLPKKSFRALDFLAQQAFQWFQHHSHPQSGMVLDRASNFGRDLSTNRMSSIAATGYHLSSLPYAVARGWLTAPQAQQISLRTMKFALTQLVHHYGLLYHFIDWETGQRWDTCEFSLLDTAIFLNGCMVVAEAYPETAALANTLLDRVEWPQFLTPHPVTGHTLLSFGWRPEEGSALLYPADVRSSELAMPYVLAAGSRTHPIPADIWYNTEVVRGEINGYQILNPSHALFTSYYGLGWMNLRGCLDRQGIDLESNARQAALANRAYCRTTATVIQQTYRKEAGGWWGLSAGDSPAGYVARGPATGDPDGTVWPMAALAAVTWLPEVVADDLAHWRDSPVWLQVAGKYGLAPFTLDKDWIGNDLIGIDLGSYLINWANYQQSAVWHYWMRHPTAQSGLQQLGYTQPQ